MKWTPILGCAALLAAGASPVVAKTSPQIYSYAVTHPVYGAIGTYDRSSDEADGLTRAEAHLRIAVRVLGVVVRRETADQTEVWRDHRLISFQSLNSTNGRRSTISGAAGGDRFAVTSPSGTETAPADVVASDPWSLNRLGPGAVVSTRTGKISSVEVTGGEPETIVLHGVSESARHYHVNTAAQPNKWEVWIDAHGVPVKFRSLETGGAIDFTLVSAPQGAGGVASGTTPGLSR
ncbi:DUF6134 family protein [Phenylobacterium sp.]|jgi:hypothetical protein|uniref:DUF6134 family protein n=1 Tax=Phenylobacterium sp. TaxID=1871053 RepID=UPI002E344C5B|nr:DUF6134 family protein [Phenylobacterium sp.]HEX3365658.1 DUF6134 family protein [Phenylobacterium sp.]